MSFPLFAFLWASLRLTVYNSFEGILDQILLSFELDFSPSLLRGGGQAIKKLMDGCGESLKEGVNYRLFDSQ